MTATTAYLPPHCLVSCLLLSFAVAGSAHSQTSFELTLAS